MKKLVLFIPILLFAVLLAACGTNSSANSSTSTSSTPTSTAKCPTISIGKIQNIGSNSLVVTTLQGKQTQVTFTSATKFARTATVPASSLQTGSFATVTIMQNANNTYSALTVSVRSAQGFQGGFTRGSTQCRNQFPRANRTATPGTFGVGQNRQTVTGTISQLSGNAMTLSNASGDDFIVNLTPSTRITAMVTASVNDLKSGQPVTITGTANAQGVISATSVSILQSLPNMRLQGTATPNSQ
ncbi:MAG TPA: DUF5666 domain-containing protein [Ktedonobacteraceae bacterium]|nr:DUF5666 domain-containing protein [Ktedonobacteraceae bacterium]